MQVSPEGIGYSGFPFVHCAEQLLKHCLSEAYVKSGSCLEEGFLLLVDNLSRNLLATEIPIGILTAFIGAPFFIYLMTRRRNVL